MKEKKFNISISDADEDTLCIVSHLCIYDEYM